MAIRSRRESAAGRRPQERRTQTRTEAALPAAYRILTKSKLFLGVAGREQPVAARIGNLSEGGVLLLVWERLLQHAVLSLRLELPGGEEPVRSLAEVRHLQEAFHQGEHPYAAGLEFLSISSRDRAAIARWIGQGGRV